MFPIPAAATLAVTAACLLSFSTLALAERESGELLFAHAPGCPHCAYQMPIVSKFAQDNPALPVRQVVYRELGSADRERIRGTSGHPVMVFYAGSCIRQVLGRTALAELEEEYRLFQQQCLVAERDTTISDTTRSRRGAVCH
jgi:hypothetical protein